MKNLIQTVATGIALSALVVGCNAKPSNSSAGVITTGLTMTGSGAPAVAQSEVQKFLSVFVSSAVALSPPPMVDSTSLVVNLSEAWVVIKEIEFESQELPGASESDGDEVEFTGPFFVDLLSNAPLSFGDAQIPEVGLRRIKMKLHKTATIPTIAPLGLANNSIYMRGTINSVAFSYAADDSTEIEIGGPKPVVPSTAKDMLVEIKTATIFKKINLSSITVSTNISATNRVTVSNPCPLIEASATDLYTCFRKGFAKEANFGNDDGDFDLDVNDESVR